MNRTMKWNPTFWCFLAIICHTSFCSASETSGEPSTPENFENLMVFQFAYAAAAMAFNASSAIYKVITGNTLTETNPYVGFAFGASILLWSQWLYRNPTITGACFNACIVCFSLHSGIYLHVRKHASSSAAWTKSALVAISINAYGAVVLTSVVLSIVLNGHTKTPSSEEL